MKNLLKFTLTLFIAIAVSSQEYPLNVNISGVYDLVYNYSSVDCYPEGFQVYYNIYGNNTYNGSNLTNYQFEFDFPWDDESCYLSGMQVFYFYAAIEGETNTTFLWNDPSGLPSGINASGLIWITPNNITIYATIYKNYTLVVAVEYVLNIYNPEAPILPPVLGVHSYLSPNYANNVTCYPEKLLVRNITNSNLLNFTWIWQQTYPCKDYGFYNKTQGIANFTCINYGICSWTLYDQYQNLSIEGTWFEDEEYLEVTFYEPFYTSYIMVSSGSKLLGLSGTFGVNTYLSPDYYSNGYCYPATIEFDPLNSYMNNSYDGETDYLYSISIYIPCIDPCQTTCGHYNSEIYINGSSYYDNIYWNFTYNFDSWNYLYGTWDSNTNNITIYQVDDRDTLFSYLMVEID